MKIHMDAPETPSRSPDGMNLRVVASLMPLEDIN